MNNVLENGSYYLIARDKNNGTVKQLPIKKSWYIKCDDDNERYRNDISVIDVVTMKFKNREELIDRLFNNGYIDSKEVDLFISHTKKNNGIDYVNEYELIFNSNERVKDLIPLANMRINGETIDIDNEHANKIFNKYISKISSNKSFFTLMTCVWSKLDKYIITKSLEYKKNNNINYGIKYLLSDKMKSYLAIRNMISMWNIYDELLSKIKIDSITEDELSKLIVQEYIKFLNHRDIRKKSYNDIIEKSDKNYVQGQISIDEYLESKSENRNNDDYNKQFSDMLKKARELKESSFDNPKLRELDKIYTRDEIYIKLDKSIFRTYSLEDQYRLGYIDYIDYKNAKFNEHLHKK